MRRIFGFIILALLFSCSAPKNEEKIFKEDLAAFIGTRSGNPLEETIWEYETGEKYNRYLWFSKDEVNLFYGLVENGELQRWSPYFYSSPYTLGNRTIQVDLSYPLWGNTEKTERASVIEGDGFTISLSDDIYTFYGTKVEEIEGFWMTIEVTVAPWK